MEERATYKMDGTLRIVLLVLVGLGALCLGASFFSNPDGYHTRFWSNLLHNSVFFTGIAFMAIFFYAICMTAYAGWHVMFKRVWEAFSQFMLVGIILIGIITLGVWLHWHHLYHWTDAASLDPDSQYFDAILKHKSSFLNPAVYTVLGLGMLGVWYFFAARLRSLSLAEDNKKDPFDFRAFRKMKVWSAVFLPIAGFTSAAAIWLWVMSVDAHWYSTLFAWYTGASWFVSMIALTILVLLYLKSQGYYSFVTSEHFHDLGKFLFAFSIFWTYLWFSQFMLIWYGNVGEETIYFKERYENYPVMFYGNLIINFIFPFFVLMRNDTKRKVGSLVIVSIVVLFGHWWDFFLMIKPGVLHTAHEALEHAGKAHAHIGGMGFPGLLEIGIFLGFLGLFLLVVLMRLGAAPLVAARDPYIQESLHHHT